MTSPPTDRDTPLRASGGRTLTTIVGVVLMVAALKLGHPVFVPLVAGLFIAVLARPLHVRLRSVMPRRLRWLGLVVTMVAVIAVVAAFAGAVTLSVRAVARELQERRPAIEAQLDRVRERASRAGLPVPSSVERGASSDERGSASDASNTGGNSGGGVALDALRWSGAALGGLALALAFAGLGLAEADEVRRRIAHVGRGTGAARALDAIDEAAPAFRRYVWVKSITSAITGAATGLAALALGLPLAWVWGFIAFLFEYVPSVGSVLAAVPPVLMALAEGGATRAATTLVTVTLLQVILGNVIDPRIEGRLMSVSPFVVLLSIVFWGWLWGPVGALLAVPLTIAVVVACRHVPGARGVASLLAGDGVKQPE